MQPDLVNRIADKELVLNFFAVFSRFEFAIKRAGYVHDNGRASVNWEGLAMDLHENSASETKESILAAAKPLLDDPPKTQTLVDGRLDWRPTTRGNDHVDLHYVFQLLFSVRNNLFHGGKYPSGEEPDIARNTTLLAASLETIQAIRNGCAAVDEEYLGVP